MDEHAIAWAAGFFDAEGTACSSQRRERCAGETDDRDVDRAGEYRHRAGHARARRGCTRRRQFAGSADDGQRMVEAASIRLEGERLWGRPVCRGDALEMAWTGETRAGA